MRKNIYLLMAMALMALGINAQTTDELKQAAVTEVYAKYTYTLMNFTVGDFVKTTGVAGEKTGAYATEVADAAQLKFVPTGNGTYYIKDAQSGLYIVYPGTIASEDGSDIWSQYLVQDSVPGTEWKLRIDNTRGNVISFFPAVLTAENPACINHGGEGLCIYQANLGGNPRSWWYLNAWEMDGESLVLSDNAPELSVYEELSNDAAYVINSERGYIYARQDQQYIYATFEDTYPFDEATDSKEFALIKTKANNYYLYNVGLQKFVDKDPGTVGGMVVDTPWNPITLTKSDSEVYPWRIALSGVIMNVTNWEDINRVKMIDVQCDPGNRFSLTVSRKGIDLSEAIKQANAFDGFYDNPVNLTWNYTHNGQVVKSTTVTIAEGDSIPQQTLPWGVSYADDVTSPTGVATADQTFELAVNYANDYPIEFSESIESAHWYSWSMRRGYVHYDGSGFPEAPEAQNTADYYWAFFGSPFGFKAVNLYNSELYLAGRGVKNQGTNNTLCLDSLENATEFQMAPTETDNLYGATYMYVADSPYECINDVSGKLGYWYTSAAWGDNGSQVSFETLSINDLQRTISLQVDFVGNPDDATVTYRGKEYKQGDLIDCDPLSTEDEFIATHFTGYTCVVTLGNGYVAVDYKSYPFEVTTDEEDPIVYTLLSGRDGELYWTYNSSCIVLRTATGATEQYWYFREHQSETDGNYYIQIVPMADPTLVMGYTDCSNGAEKVYSADVTTAGFYSDWVFVNEGDGFYGFAPATNTNLYLSNWGGTGFRMGFWQVGPTGDNGTQIKEMKGFEPTDLWTQVETNMGTRYGQYRETDELWEAIENLQSLSFEYPTYMEWQSGVTEFFAVADAHYIWFHEGQCYTITSVQPDSTTYAFYMGEVGLSLGEANVPAAEYGDSAVFVCHASEAESGKYYFENFGKGNILCFMGGALGYNGDTGYTPTYEAHYCDFMLGLYEGEEGYFWMQGTRSDNYMGCFWITPDKQFKVKEYPTPIVFDETGSTALRIDEVETPVPSVVTPITVQKPVSTIVYDLTGRRVADSINAVSQHGIYIVGGQKVLVK